jgi:sulfite reductase (NADPH) hemoprotein beta-component
MSEKLSPIEKIKINSQGLRGTLKESVKDDEHTGAIREDDQAVVKFHGMYMQDDRDRREERSAKRLEWLYSYMIRLRLPGGFLTADQWVATHHIAGEHSTGVIKITTRQTIQLHGIVKSKIKPTLQSFDQAGLDSIATCGDINRNVTCNAFPSQNALHAEVHSYAEKISRLLMPKTKAYYDVWINDEPITDNEKADETDPLYQDRYLPRKFKIGIALPPQNDVDVLTNDIGLIAIVENGKLLGFNIAVGGGLSFTHGNGATYPRLATVIGFADTEEKVLKTVYEIVTVQRDFGNRADRKQARLKYTVDKLTPQGYREEVEKRIGFKLEEPKPYVFEQRKDDFGWLQAPDGTWSYNIFVECGRITDDQNAATKTALYEIAKLNNATFRFTCNQNVMVSDIKEADKAVIDEILERFNVKSFTEKSSALRLNSMACVAFNTCPLALAEAQRYLPTLVSKIEPILEKHGLSDDDIIMRMTGCPNGCGRSTASEIGFVGTGYGSYNMHIGGDRLGQRLNQKYKDNLGEPEILAELDSLFGMYKKNKKQGQTFGDFTFENVLN